MKRLLLVGTKRGLLTVLSEQGIMLTCRCDCGNLKEVRRGNFMAGYTTSCGCFRNAQITKANFKHGQSGYTATKAYRSWKAMWSRVRNPQRDHAHRYLERGIDIDPRWQDFSVFFAEMGERPDGTEIDRIDNNKGYWPGNCRWVTHKENCNNRGY